MKTIAGASIIFAGAVGALAAFAATARAAVSEGETVSLRSARNDCVDFSTAPLTETYHDGSREAYYCRVSQFKSVGKIEGRSYYAALYCFSDAKDRTSNNCYPEQPEFGGLAIFERTGENQDARLVIADMPQAAGDLTFQWYKEPEIFRNASGIFLEMTAGRNGTGHENTGDYYQWRQGRWAKIDSALLKTARDEDWAPYLPAGASLEFGIRPDMSRLTAEEDFGRGGKAPGVAHIKLAVKNGRFAVNSVYLTGGHTMAWNDDNAEDLQAANTALSDDPKDASAYFARGLAYSDRGDDEKALEDFDQGLRIKPDAAAYNARGLLHAARGEYDLAIRDYGRALKLAPNEPRLYDNRGSAYADRGDDDRAIKDYSRALELNPKFAAARRNRSAAYFAKGDKAAALKDRNRAREMNPGDAYPDRRYPFLIRGSELR